MRADEVDFAGILYSGFSKYPGIHSPICWSQHDVFTCTALERCSFHFHSEDGSNFMKLLIYLLQMASGKTPSILMEAFVN
jgi:hypothetical protein